jgi:hypothetical protein
VLVPAHVIDLERGAPVARTTIGYGDLHPVTAAGRVFTMVYVFVGVGVLVAFVTRLAQALAQEGDSAKSS